MALDGLSIGIIIWEPTRQHGIKRSSHHLVRQLLYWFKFAVNIEQLLNSRPSDSSALIQMRGQSSKSFHSYSLQITLTTFKMLEFPCPLRPTQGKMLQCTPEAQWLSCYLERMNRAIFRMPWSMLPALVITKTIVQKTVYMFAQTTQVGQPWEEFKMAASFWQPSWMPLSSKNSCRFA